VRLEELGQLKKNPMTSQAKILYEFHNSYTSPNKHYMEAQIKDEMGGACSAHGGR
jgi:hypothetical protein